MGKNSPLFVSRDRVMVSIIKMLPGATDADLEEIIYTLWGDKRCYSISICFEPQDDERLP